MIQEFKTFCPLFPGFYGTVFEYDNEDSDIENYNYEYKTKLGYDDFEWDYSDYHKRVSSSFVNRCERELKQYLDISMDFEELVSPREYNFRNDSINVTVKLDLKELLSLIRERYNDAKEYFKDKYTSCSGFISFHSNDIDEWLDKDYIMENPEHRIGALLDCLLSTEISQDDIMYWTDGESWIDFSPKETEPA
jgi:hypothetical protein